VDRVAALANLLTSFNPSKPMEIMYMYYDTVEGVPAICGDVEYARDIVDCVSCIF